MDDSSNELRHSSNNLVVIIVDNEGFQEIWYELSLNGLQLEVFKDLEDGFDDFDAHVGFLIVEKFVYFW